MKEVTTKELKCIRYLSNEMSKEDRSVFEIELSIDNELKKLYLEYLAIWTAYPTSSLELHHEVSQQKIEGEIKRKPIFKNLYVYAASLLIIILSSLALFNYSNESVYTNIKTAEAGERLRFMLPDSSQVVLNSGSKLKYSENFDNPREVWLEGEGYFEISKDSTCPFIVHTNDMKIKVLGTSFGVNTENTKKTVSLATGKVKVFLTQSNDEVYLLPKEQLTYNVSTREVTKSNFNPEKLLSWKENILLLDNLSLQMAIPKVNKFFGVKFSIADRSIESQRITGAFKDQNLEEFISAMEFITNVSVVKKGSHNYLIKASNEN